ncbi:hypothetical protein F1559_001435 [Cyanidiococcus yangmingshanensis]|uniref:Uncharacterized protein n=1 Tax=Cyanidiococcus yangmingshanensis TaxID=2690220 RepID=A0A7J7INS3_9RHOD|nr:hypothetical protein F1559_001435 [Cyanidiococcus yangmingshanensis]
MLQRKSFEAIKRKRERLKELETALVGMRLGAQQQSQDDDGDVRKTSDQFLENLVARSVPEAVVLECVTTLVLRQLRDLWTFAPETVLPETDPVVSEALAAFQEALENALNNTALQEYLKAENSERLLNLARLLGFRLRQNLSTHQPLYLAAIRIADQALRAYGTSVSDFTTFAEDDMSTDLDACLGVWDDPRHQSDVARIDAWMTIGGPLAHALAFAWASHKSGTASQRLDT